MLRGPQVVVWGREEQGMRGSVVVLGMCSQDAGAYVVLPTMFDRPGPCPRRVTGSDCSTVAAPSTRPAPSTHARRPYPRIAHSAFALTLCRQLGVFIFPSFETDVRNSRWTAASELLETGGGREVPPTPPPRHSTPLRGGHPKSMAHRRELLHAYRYLKPLS